jgi:hypothetical protein
MAKKNKQKKVIELKKPKKQTQADAEKMTMEERVLRLEIALGIVGNETP